MATRPLGIALLSVLIWLVSGILLLGGLLLLALSVFVAATPGLAEEIARAMGHLPGIPFPIISMMTIGMLLALISVFLLVVGAISLLVGWGLWAGRNWARWIAIIFYGFGALSNLVNVLQGQFGSIIGLVIDGLIVYYLFLPHVKAFFRAAV